MVKNDTKSLIDNNMKHLIENYFGNHNRKNNKLNNLIKKYILENSFNNAVDLYYYIKDYSMNMAIEVALMIIKKEGKYLDETFLENVELEISYHGNYETGKILKKYFNESEEEDIKTIYKNIYSILVNKYNGMGLNLENIIEYYNKEK